MEAPSREPSKRWSMGASVSETATQIVSAFRSKFDLLANEEIHFIRMSKFTVRETNRFDFAIVYDIGKEGKDADESKAELIEMVKSLTKNGIAVDVLYDNTVNEDSLSLTVLLLRVTKKSLLTMGRDLQIERWVAGGCYGGLELHSDEHYADKMTYAERLQIGELVVDAAGVREKQGHVKAVVPLFCDNFRKKFLLLYVQKLNIWRVLKRRTRQMWKTIKEGDDNPDVKKAAETFVNGQLPNGQIPNNHHSLSVFGMSHRRSVAEEDLGLIDNKFFIHELRAHFGEKVALYFAFVDHYSRWLIIPLITGTGVFITQYIFSARTYAQILAVFGCAVSAIWAPLMNKFWKRKNNEINLIWGTTNSSERDYRWKFHDPQYRGYCRKRNFLPETETDDTQSFNSPETSELDIFHKFPLMLLLAAFTLLQIAIMIIVTGMFVHLYIYLKTVPACNTQAPSSTSICFTGFTRWLAILAQGAGLGLFVDIIQWEWLKATAKWFAAQFNPMYEAQFEDSYTLKVFIFEWLNMYAWFWLLAFLYVPFGNSWSDLVNQYFHTGLKIDSTKIDLQDAFITPLVVTQLLNFLIDTFVPILIDSILNYKRMKRRDLDPTEDVKARAEKLATELSEYASPYLVRAYNSCGTPEDPQAKFVDVVRVHTKSSYSTFSDIDDMCMQYGYVTMFSVIWPLIPLCAFVNNIYEVRGDVMRLCYASRRPIQRKVTNLGRWDSFFVIVGIISAIINTALICVSTGQLECFVTRCQQQYEIDSRFRPDVNCFSWGERLSLAALIEHTLLLVQLIIYTKISGDPGWVQQRKKLMEKQTVLALASMTRAAAIENDAKQE